MKRLFVVAISLLMSVSNLRAQTVALDYYFNHETRKAKDGTTERFHYTWEDNTNTGFSTWSDTFKKLGAKLTAIEQAPSKAILKDAAVYIIVDPDTRKESPDPQYISNADADVIAAWVHKGGALVLLANDSVNTELLHFNVLAAKFGMHFNNDMQNHVVNDAHFEDGAVQLKVGPVFKKPAKIFMKDVCSISLSHDARALITATNGTPIAAVNRYGKGLVIAVGDPWLYNEYVNGRLPAGFENDKAMEDLSAYLLLFAAKNSTH